MSMLALQHPDKSRDKIVCSTTRHPKEQQSDVAFILATQGKLWMAGVSIDWNKFYADKVYQRIPLPTYPFERKRYWIESGKKAKSVDVAALFSSTKEEEGVSVAESTAAEKLTATPIATSKDSMEKTLATIWQELLGVNHVSVDDNFFDLGGSSMMAARLFARIEKSLGKRLPLSALYDSPTVKQLAELIGEKQRTEQWSSLVEIKSGGTKPPLFLVHGAGGNVLIYRDLAHRLGADQPVYGLQSQGLDGKQPFLSKVEDMATHYLKEIKAAHPQGPYMLGGYCLGGSVAWEMAQQLKAQGENVPLVALFETYNFSKIGHISASRKAYSYFQKIDFHLRNFLLLKDIDKWTFIKEKAKVARGRVKVWWGMLTAIMGRKGDQAQKQSAILADIWEANDRAAFAYVPKAYPGRIIQFLPVKEYAHHIGPELGMDKLADAEFVSYTLPVYPAGMMVEPFIQLLTEKLKDCINKALESESINKK
jgi:acyl carrier protein